MVIVMIAAYTLSPTWHFLHPECHDLLSPLNYTYGNPLSRVGRFNLPVQNLPSNQKPIGKNEAKPVVKNGDDCNIFEFYK